MNVRVVRRTTPSRYMVSQCQYMPYSDLPLSSALPHTHSYTHSYTLSLTHTLTHTHTHSHTHSHSRTHTLTLTLTHTQKPRAVLPHLLSVPPDCSSFQRFSLSGEPPQFTHKRPRLTSLLYSPLVLLCS